ncbi:hypothetical protein TW65_04360 [Stemphylium lycopersici]|uniref:Uncharacterized protein n=1 Tax=Stemphylium lycopersici TaxID=183478 RepID=A0A364NAH4_STELY|nr:hypothetical protein TW65_04360 [Stemphylium lycopersici]RAR14031.1 hypothetical protein DDE83_002600 [Stemphylium lycopersici]
MDSVHAALLTCPNITHLDLSVDDPTCTTGYASSLPFNPMGGERYPNLTILKLYGYDLRRTETDGPENKINWELWVDAMDWTKIEELGLRNPLPKALSRVLGTSWTLRRLESADPYLMRVLQNNTLTHLSWVDRARYNRDMDPRAFSIDYADLDAILDRQGKSLQSLEFRCTEITSHGLPYGQFNFSTIRDRTENLAHLSIDVPRNGTWPLEILKDIAAIPTLQRADIWFNMQSECQRLYENHNHANPDHTLWTRSSKDRHFGKDFCKGEDRFQKPYLNKTSALELFKHMRANKEGIELSEVTFWIGDWMTRPWESLVWGANFLDGRRAQVECHARDDVDMEDWCVVEKWGEEYWTKSFPPSIPWDDDDDWELDLEEYDV